MKNRCFISASAVMSLLILFVCASGAGAENRAGAFNVTPFVGGYNLDKSYPYDNAWTYGIGLGYNFTEKLGTEFTFNYADTNDVGVVDPNTAIDPGTKDASIYLYKLDLLYHLTDLLPGDMIVPYVAAGAGGISYDTERSGVDTKNNFLLNYGGGLKLFLTRNVALRGDVRHVIDFRGGDNFNNLLYTAGLTYEIGGKGKEVEPEPAAAPEPAPAPAPEIVTPPAPAPKEQGTITFRNILFDFNKYTVKSESYPILDEVTDYLKANAGVKMEVQGYCDNKGTHKYNLKLSDERAKAVRKYLVGKGIAADRLTAKGYSFDNPVASNATEEGRALNRRVVFKPIQ